MQSISLENLFQIYFSNADRYLISFVSMLDVVRHKVTRLTLNNGGDTDSLMSQW